MVSSHIMVDDGKAFRQILIGLNFRLVADGGQVSCKKPVSAVRRARKPSNINNLFQILNHCKPCRSATVHFDPLHSVKVSSARLLLAPASFMDLPPTLCPQSTKIHNRISQNSRTRFRLLMLNEPRRALPETQRQFRVKKISHLTKIAYRVLP